MTPQQAVTQYVEKTKAWASSQQKGANQKAIMAFLKREQPVSEQSIEDTLPEYWIGYNYAVKQEQSILPHTQRGLFPRRLFDLRTPNQTQEELQYIRNTFKSVTLPVWSDLIATITRACNRQNYKYKIEADESIEMDMEDYLNKGIPEFGSIFFWFQSMLPAINQRSANGVIAVMPSLPVTLASASGKCIILRARFSFLSISVTKN